MISSTKIQIQLQLQAQIQTQIEIQIQTLIQLQIYIQMQIQVRGGFVLVILVGCVAGVFSRFCSLVQQPGHDKMQAATALTKL